ncbi:uncharacterized protein LAESUDRAFT_731710 [Laetiporus sulphureus 93-53]|uniref:Uncharacterized protein n=1 Tax=Laetiporus sulphureus 93-53 TaxID=1314785 RepID=A0A165BG43_9APHY|nr:uncharacterized protein LAESUDRAFT_731710 [Laetiporus sulphureus 93-53]KZT00986.1 hypothetical protein LAESUDRAFT_731710 [Laetiporus sulphureus 93-53]
MDLNPLPYDVILQANCTQAFHIFPQQSAMSSIAKNVDDASDSQNSIVCLISAFKGGPHWGLCKREDGTSYHPQVTLNESEDTAKKQLSLGLRPSPTFRSSTAKWLTCFW